MVGPERAEARGGPGGEVAANPPGLSFPPASRHGSRALLPGDWGEGSSVPGPLPLSDYTAPATAARATLVHPSLWDEPRPPTILPAAPRAPAKLEYLPWVE